MESEMKKSVAMTNEKVSNHIHEDIAFSILSKLPVKSLTRFECVRKSWSLLFENPQFMSMFRNNFLFNKNTYNEGASLLLNFIKSLHADHPHQIMLYYISGERFENKVKLKWPNPFNEDDPHPGFFIFGQASINGVLCIYNISRKKVLLWNPSIDEFKVIPPSPFGYETPYRHLYFIIQGFGYDRVKDDYKVIREISFIPLSTCDKGWKDVPKGISYRSVWEIYSLRSDSWRILDFHMPYCVDDSVGAKLYLDGMCHWWGSDETLDNLFLVSFDVSNEVFITTPIVSNNDDCFDNRLVIKHMMVLNGSIAWITNYEKTTTFHISILGEVGVKESWIKLMIVGPLTCVKYLIGVGKNGDIFFTKEKDNELVWFNSRTQMVKELGIKVEPRNARVVIYRKNPFPIGRIDS